MKIYNIDFIIIERKDDIRRIFLNQRYKEDISPHDSINIQNFRHWYLKNENTWSFALQPQILLTDLRICRSKDLLVLRSPGRIGL